MHGERTRRSAAKIKAMRATNRSKESTPTSTWTAFRLKRSWDGEVKNVSIVLVGLWASTRTATARCWEWSKAPRRTRPRWQGLPALPRRAEASRSTA